MIPFSRPRAGCKEKAPDPFYLPRAVKLVRTTFHA